MAQNPLNLANTKGQEVAILASSQDAKNAATLLKSYLDQAFENHFIIEFDNKKTDTKAKIILQIANDYNAIK